MARELETTINETPDEIRVTTTTAPQIVSEGTFSDIEQAVQHSKQLIKRQQLGLLLGFGVSTSLLFGGLSLAAEASMFGDNAPQAFVGGILAMGGVWIATELLSPAVSRLQELKEVLAREQKYARAHPSSPPPPEQP